MQNNHTIKRCDLHNNQQPSQPSKLLAATSDAPPSLAPDAEQEVAQEASTQTAESLDSAALAAARQLIPKELRDRKFRAKSFAASLSTEQLVLFSTWMDSSLT